MNEIQLGIKDVDCSGKKELRLELRIDGVEFLEKIDEKLNAASFDELEKSCIKSGCYLIFTCECGIADCAGWSKIFVIHENDTVSWKFEYDEKHFKYKFGLHSYKKEIERFSKEINQSQVKLQPQYVIDPE